MIEFIILFIIFVASFLFSTAIQYYWEKQPLKKSIGTGLIEGTFLTAGLTLFVYRYRLDYQLIIVGSIVMGIMLFLLQTVNRYYVQKEPLEESIKESIMDGLIAGIVFVILLLILTSF